MSIHPRPVLFECTLRDSSYVVNFQFTADHTRRLCAELERAGFEYIEIGHGAGLGASRPEIGMAAEPDEAYLDAAASVLTRAKWGTFFIPGIAEPRHLEMAAARGMGFVRIGTNITEFRQAEPHLYRAKTLGLAVSINLMKTYAVDGPEFRRTVTEIGRWQPDSIYIVDSAGCMLPETVREYTRVIRNETGADAGIHAHHNLQLAVSNSLVALEEGARFVDTTLRGIGRSAGNAQTEVVLALLQQRGLAMEIDLMRTLMIADEVFVPMMRQIVAATPGTNRAEVERGSSPTELVLGLGRCHSGFLPMIEEVARAHGVNPLRLVLAVSARDCVRPSRALCNEVAAAIAAESVVRAGAEA